MLHQDCCGKPFLCKHRSFFIHASTQLTDPFDCCRFAIPGAGGFAKLSEATNEQTPFDVSPVLEFATPRQRRAVAWVQNFVWMINIVLVCTDPRQTFWQILLAFTMSSNVLLRAILRIRKSAEMFNTLVALRNKFENSQTSNSVIRFQTSTLRWCCQGQR